MMRFGKLALLVGLFALVASGASAGTITFTTTPAGGAITGQPGETVGWGYTLENDTDSYVSIDDISINLPGWTVDASIFDYPFLAPFSTVFVPFAIGATGLAQVTVPADATFGDVVTGTYHLTGSLWGVSDGDTSELIQVGETSFDGNLSATAVPEPATMGLLLTGLVGLAGRRFRKNR